MRFKMCSIPILVAPLLLYLTVNALPDQAPLHNEISHGPSIEHARANAPQVFNALHSSMRQWGSSLKHNGMSFFPATIPEGTLFYHGTYKSEPVTGMEWLAFEIEHAESFARPRGGPPPGKGPGGGPGGGPPSGHPPDGPRHPPDDNEEGLGFGPPEKHGKNFNHESKDWNGDSHGYLHQYRASRPLSKLLYIDGMSAGKTSMGTLDSTDYIIRNLSSASTAPNDDRIRAADLCEIGKQWGIEGFLRMEAGFEIILCNFTDGLEFLSATQRPETRRRDEISHFEYIRAIGYRYQGIVGGRTEIDYSSMVSAFFYPVNLTNPNPTRLELPRTVDPTDTERLLKIRSDVLSQFQRDEKHEKIDWQGVVDMIVTRYSDRLQFMLATSTSEYGVLSELAMLLNVFTDYSHIDVPSSIEKCATHYLKAVSPKTKADNFIHAAILTVSYRICSTLYEVRQLLEDAEEKGAKKEREAKQMIKELIVYLDWTTWLECGKCAYDEVCYVAIWPWGFPEDHTSPGCVKKGDVQDRRGYWEFGRLF
ncbi:hypothetical protein ACMFMG_003068 [Clarireedia jacksonii]